MNDRLSLLRRLLAFALLLALPHAGWAQIDSIGSKPTSFADSAGDEVEMVEFLPVEEAYQLVTAINGDSLYMDWTIAPEYYLYKHRFSVKATDTAGNKLPVELNIPEGLAKTDEYFGDVEVYYHNVSLDLSLASLPGDTQFALKSQGCADAGLCYPPQTAYFHTRDGQVYEGKMPVEEAPAISPQAPADEQADVSLLAVLLMAMLGGLILNLMPCVFPVLSLKALHLAGASDRNHVAEGLSYTAGVVLSFVAVAALMITLRSAGEAIGWGFQLQSPFFIALLCYLFFVLGLNLLGVFEFSFAFAGIGNKLTEGDSLSASFFTGVLAAVVASPCTAPFMGTALGYAMTQSTPVALTVFASLGLGLALPFLLIALIPALGRMLPNPGAWMETFRQLLAYPLFLTCVWLLWVAGNQAGTGAMAAVLIGCILISAAIWAWRPHHVARASSVAMVVAAIAILYSPWVETKAVDKGQSSEEWSHYTDETLEALLADGKPVFVNITADWCITCLANERVTLSTDEVKSFFQERGITYLKGDWTNPSPMINDYLARHNRNGVPLYVAYSKEQGTKVLPQILTREEVFNAFDGAGL